MGVDQDRVYLAGYSMGGRGCWELALAAPQRFAAMVPGQLFERVKTTRTEAAATGTLSFL